MLLLKQLTCYIGQSLAAFLPALWLWMMIRQTDAQAYSWLFLLPSALLAAASPQALKLANEKRLPLCALMIAAMAAGLVWPVLWFSGGKKGLAFLWQFVCLALKITALIEAGSASKALRTALAAGCALLFLLCAGSFCAASGAADGFIAR